MFLRADVAPLFAGRDPFTVIREWRGEVVRVMPGRRTLKVNWQGRSFFLKHHFGVGYWEILKNWLFFRRPVVDAENEFRAAQALSALGINTLRVAAYERRGDNPATRESFVLCDAIDHEESLEQMVRRWRKERAPLKRRRALIREVARIAGTMHANGINHRDFYVGHFLRDVSDRLHLIDLHRAQIRAAVPRRWLIKDLGSLWFSAMDMGLSRGDRHCFVSTYGRAFRNGQFNERFWRAVRERANNLYAKGLRQGIVGDIA